MPNYAFDKSYEINVILFMTSLDIFHSVKIKV